MTEMRQILHSWLTTQVAASPSRSLHRPSDCVTLSGALNASRCHAAAFTPLAAATRHGRCPFRAQSSPKAARCPPFRLSQCPLCRACLLRDSCEWLLRRCCDSGRGRTALATRLSCGVSAPRCTWLASRIAWSASVAACPVALSVVAAHRTLLERAGERVECVASLQTPAAAREECDAPPCPTRSHRKSSCCATRTCCRQLALRHAWR